MHSQVTDNFVLLAVEYTEVGKHGTSSSRQYKTHNLAKPPQGFYTLRNFARKAIVPAEVCYIVSTHFIDKT